MREKEKKKFRLAITIFASVTLCILINWAGKYVAIKAELPLWLDTLGTALCAYVYGPICGAIVGMSVNIMFAIDNPMVLLFGVVNIATGLIVGFAAKKKMMRSYFEVSKVASLLTIVATVISTALNMILFNGTVGNKWGEGVAELLRHQGVEPHAASLVGEFFVDFADKILTMTVLYWMINGVRYVRKKRRNRRNARREAAMLGLIAILVLGSLQDMQVVAATNEEKGPDYNSYIQTIYNNSNGLSCGEANDIVATNDGVLWVATYAGLYRYSGTEFQHMDAYESIKNANDLYVDEEGRLWVGTNDKGLSICSKEVVTNVLDAQNGLPSNSVRSIVRNTEGDYLVGTSASLAVVSLAGGISTKKVIDEIQYAQSLSADAKGHTAAVTAQGELFLLKGTEIQCSITNDNEYFTSCRYGRDGLLYVTTDVGYIYVYDTAINRFFSKDKIFVTGLTSLNSTYEMENGTIFVCADEGVCYLDEKNRAHVIETGAFNSSIDNMTVDYQGNIWFSSSRQGLLKLCPSAFSELYISAGVNEKVVNSVAIWQGKIYCGTDSGLDVIDKASNAVIVNKLVRELAGVRIRNVYVDSRDRLWICSTIGSVIRVDADGTIRYIGERQGVIGTKFRQALELQDGTIAIASDKGVSVLNDIGVIYTLDTSKGLTNPIVLCMYQREDGSILLGTDGGGIAITRNGRVTQMYSNDVLDSGVVLRIVKDRDNEGAFIVTSNGICYINAEDEVRRFSNFPYSNNYDIYDNGQGMLFVTGSAGIYVVEKAELFLGGTVHYEQLNYVNGLRQSITANSWNCAIDDDSWFICNNAGVTRLDLKKYQDGAKSFRLIINSVKIDGVSYIVDRSEDIVISGENAVLELRPEIINYTAENPTIRYYMEGYDDVPFDVSQSELHEVEYRGLPAGTHRFHLAVLDKYNNIVEEQIYTFVRRQEFYETGILIAYFVVGLVGMIAWIAWVLTRLYMQKSFETKNREVARALEQVRLGNETILTIAKTVDAKDENTSQHSFRVSEYSVMIGKELGYNEKECENLRKSALLHDIGKIGIPDSVLNKPGRLNDEEYAIMKSHVVRGGEILKNFTVIPHVQEGAMYHHERYDGKGYAHGLKGEEIPEYARIIGVADAFDAMTANRVYRKQLDLAVVIEELKKGRGTQFDPRMADIMLGLIEQGKIDVQELYQSSRKEESHA